MAAGETTATAAAMAATDMTGTTGVTAATATTATATTTTATTATTTTATGRPTTRAPSGSINPRAGSIPGSAPGVTQSSTVYSFLSPWDLAKAVGVSESSVKRWIDGGRIRAHRTAGGHRRVALGEAIRFVREAGLPLVRPDLLGLSDLQASGAGALADERPAQLLTLLRDGSAAAARGLLVSWYLEGACIAELSDGPLRSSLEALGELWQHGEEGIVVEHRATEIWLQAVHQLRLLLPAAGEGAPLAVGGSPGIDLCGSQL